MHSSCMHENACKCANLLACLMHASCMHCMHVACMIHARSAGMHSLEGSNDLTVIKMDNGSTLTDEREISECMNEFFASVFTRENLENIPSFEQIITNDSLSFL